MNDCVVCVVLWMVGGYNSVGVKLNDRPTYSGLRCIWCSFNTPLRPLYLYSALLRAGIQLVFVQYTTGS